MEGWNGSEKKGGTLIRERDSFIKRFFSLNKISRLLCMRKLFENKETFLEVAHINYPRHFLNTFWAETFFLRLQIQIFLRVPTVRLSFLKNHKERRLMLWLLPFQNWLAYDLLPEAWNFTEQGRLHFSGLGAPKKESNYAFCQVGKCDVY